ncbi:DUF3862 domain-containing protein [Streptococcus didelphis]|uniref:DUF3862 domain-containing protein n=1 Tax=Streptococcus didelphis TaxID=102886 RepID=UPI0003677826|nr:DUF3862 domain-containing protein [Streptococcus didelphis]
MLAKKLLPVFLLSLSCLSLGACKTKENHPKKADSDNKPALNFQKKEETAHLDKRTSFEKIKVANAQGDFKGGSSLEDLKALYGEPSEHQEKPAGNVTLNAYTWVFDRVRIQANLFENSTIVKSISNFAYDRDYIISLKKYNQIKKGMSYSQVTSILTEPDDYTQASSSDKEQLQAIWISGLKATDKGANITLLFENNQLVEKSQKGLSN